MTRIVRTLLHHGYVAAICIISYMTIKLAIMLTNHNSQICKKKIATNGTSLFTTKWYKINTTKDYYNCQFRGDPISSNKIR